MYSESQHEDPIQIRSADDAWNAMYEHGLKQTLKSILDYFLKSKKTHDFTEFCHSLSEDYLIEALEYFLENFNQDKFVKFFDNLTIDQQTIELSYLLNDVCVSKDVANYDRIIQFRQNLCTFDTWKKSKKPPENVQDAIKCAKDNSFDKVIYFLQENPKEIRKFISQLGDQDKEMILNGLVLELMDKLPYKPEEEEMPIAA